MSAIGGIPLGSIAGNLSLPRVCVIWRKTGNPAFDERMLQALQAQDYPLAELKIIEPQDSARLNLKDETSAPFVCLLEGNVLPQPDCLSKHMQLHLGLPWPVAVSYESENFTADTKTELLPDPDFGVSIGAIAKPFYAELARTSACNDPSVQPWLSADARVCVYRSAAVGIFQSSSPAAAGIAANDTLLPFCHFIGGSASLASGKTSSLPAIDTDAERAIRISQLGLLLQGAEKLSHAAPFRYWRAANLLARGAGTAEVHALAGRELPGLLKTFGAQRTVNSLALLIGPRSVHRLFLSRPALLSPSLLWHLGRMQTGLMRRKK